MNVLPLRPFEKILFTLCLAGIALGSCLDFFDIAWGTGIWLGEFSIVWFVIFSAYCIICLSFLVFLGFVIWRDSTHIAFANRLISIRSRFGSFRWLFVLIVFIFPIWLFQFSVWGMVFQGFFIRCLAWAAVLFLTSVLITTGTKLVTWMNFLVMIILTASAFSIFASLNQVTDYPFSLGWSEGNRLWDYSIMFGRDRYDYPSDKPIFVLLEQGRQFVGALPFLIPGITIKPVRAWIGLLAILPYLILGLVSYSSLFKEKVWWIMLGLWTFLFLKQGPIHPPLVFCAILVVLAWGRPLWLSIFLMVLSGYFASISRYTWIFAPAIWIVLLEFSGASILNNNQLNKSIWIRSAVLFCFGLLGSILLPQWIKLSYRGSPNGLTFANYGENISISTSSLQENISRQPLLWYRLFPNPTYGAGIIIGLLLAVGPLIYLLYYLWSKNDWKINFLQKLMIMSSLLAFLVVGLIVSTKIGGGGDLHNMDMFLIGLYFSMLIAWLKGGKRWLETSEKEPGWIKLIIVISLVLPAIGPLQEMRSYNLEKYTSWLVTLTGVRSEKSLEMYPSRQIINDSLNSIQHEIDLAQRHGEILFLDQRQLLTFGYIRNVPLIPEYEKKVLMEQALASNYNYFEAFYSDLQKGRFALIVTQPLNTPKKGSDYPFGEENNAWVKWVTNPVLCYYEIKQTLVEVNVQLLVPQSGPVDCSKQVP